MNFSGHETFPFRYSWLPKGFALLRKDRDSLTNPEGAMVELGLGKNMVRSLRHWLLATRLCEPIEGRGRGVQLTQLAHSLFDEENGWDRFIEDPGTLWLLHWHLCATPERATTWHVAFSYVRGREFTKKDLLNVIGDYIADRAEPPVAEKTLQRDVDCFLRCYASDTSEEVPEDSLSCPLGELDLIGRVPDADRGDVYAFARGPQLSLDDRLLAWCLTDYWERTHERAESLSFDRLAYAPGSPGMILRLDDISLAQRLDRLEEVTGGLLHFSESAGIRQLMRRNIPDRFPLLESYYHAAS